MELLSPAGSLEAGYAALQYGADAVYLGLQQFSARADADNFNPNTLNIFTTYAHSLKKRVYVAINTLVQTRDLPALIESLSHAERAGVDAVIVQDIGVAEAIRRYFKTLQIHASTQMTVHNPGGCRQLKEWGFSRVILARELTLSEIKNCLKEIEVEVFVHGALCYGYSGLCNISSHLIGRSANRGKCAALCRELYTIGKQAYHLFSMSDLSLADQLSKLSDVTALKIEGRKKTPLYVAAVTDYYRRRLNGEVFDYAQAEENLKTIFSRQWTTFFLNVRNQQGLIDPYTSGHSGALIGFVEYSKSGILRFTTSREIQKHDGIQINLQYESRQLGFGIDAMRVRGKLVMAAHKGSEVELVIPSEITIPIGTPVYCSSSCTVKQSYPITTPSPKVRTFPLDVKSNKNISGFMITISAATDCGLIHTSLTVPHDQLDISKDSEKALRTAQDVWSRLGGSSFHLNCLDWDASVFMPVSRWNEIRREMVSDLENKLNEQLSDRLRNINAELDSLSGSGPAGVQKWILRIDDFETLSAFSDEVLCGIAEIQIVISSDTQFFTSLALLEKRVGRSLIRLVVPPIVREFDSAEEVTELAIEAGWYRWEIANISGFQLIKKYNMLNSSLDLTADSQLHTLNPLAVEFLKSNDISRVTLSTEDDCENVKELLSKYGSMCVVPVFQNTALMIGEACPVSAVSKSCKEHCDFSTLSCKNRYGQSLLLISKDCRTTVINEQAYCISRRLSELKDAGFLRVDFVNKIWSSDEALSVWSKVRRGEFIENTYEANWVRRLR